MSAHRIPGLEQVPGYGCSPFKAVRELGSETSETVRSPILCGRRKIREAALVREDRGGRTSVYGLLTNGIAR